MDCLMSRNLLAAVIALAVCLVASADPPAPPVANIPGQAPELVGGWTVAFGNGVVETCVICPDGTVAVTEPLRTSAGKVEMREAQAVLVFVDSRVERWTVVGDKRVVEHYATADQFPN